MNFPYGYPYVSPYDSVYDSYGTLRPTETDTPQSYVEPLTLAAVKNYLRVAVEDTSQDITIAVMIAAAREQAEILQGRDLVKKQWDLYYDYWPEYRVRLRAPCVSVDLVRYTDLAGADTPMTKNTDYVVDLTKEPALITPPWNRSWPAFTPRPSSAILIRFTSGYAPDAAFWSGSGARIKMGMQMLINSWFENRLPFEKGSGAISEFPYAVGSCLSFGALERVR
jgi:uncharacterized phiE125 gp8 family phage protein